MRTSSLLAPAFGTLLFVACSGGGDGAGDANDGGASTDAARDVSKAPDAAAAGDARIDHVSPEADASTSADASADATDASADAGADASADASADAGPDTDASDAGETPTNAVASSAAAFENAGGANTYAGGLGAGNWVASGVFITSNAGGEWFGSGNGNATGSFQDLSFTKNLGGIVEDRPYTVSFYVSQYADGYDAIELSDFSVLRIGGPDGAVVWTDTPPPIVTDVWVKWTGTYTPAPTDVGGPFYFEMVFDLDAQHTVGVDGPFVAVP